jgi:hypothetical protein
MTVITASYCSQITLLYLDIARNHIILKRDASLERLWGYEEEEDEEILIQDEESARIECSKLMLRIESTDGQVRN